MADNATLVALDTSTEGVEETTLGVKYQRDLLHTVVAIGILAGVVVAIILAIWVIWWKFCKSPRSRHGNERGENNPVGLERGSSKKQYYDQFCVNDHQLTVNSVTAIKWDEDEKGSNKSSGIDCDSHSSELREERKVVTVGKRVFSVNKVQEKSPTSAVPKTSNNKGVVIRLPKQYSEITRSLQAGDGKNYMLAIINKQSQTVHNIDLRNYRLRRSVSPNAAVSSSSSAQERIHQQHQRRHRHRSEGQCRSSGAQSVSATMIHDSPDFSGARRLASAMVAESADEARTTRSLTDFSDSSGSAGERRSDSLSSHDEESGKELLESESTERTGGRSTDDIDESEKENLLNDH